MSSSEPINHEAVRIYVDGAREALRNAQYNLEGGYYGAAVSRAYYACFYAATALLLTLDLTRSKHSGVLAAFREHFVKPGIFSVHDSQAYGNAFELRNITDYEQVGQADKAQAQTVIKDVRRFVEHCETYLASKGYL